MNNRNPFDDLNGFDVSPEEKEKINKQNQEKYEKIDKLIHKTFKQNADGAELLSIWKKAMDDNPGAEPGMDMLEVGIREGYKRFIRLIVRTINKMEKTND